MRRQLLSASFLLLLPSLVAQAQTEARQASLGERTVYLLPQAGGARLELPGGQTVDLALPERADLLSLAATEEGWVAAGTRIDQDGSRRLVILEGSSGRPEELEAPPGQRAAIRDQPVLLVAGGRLTGLAWLEGEGESSLAVRAATWDGHRWGAVERVAVSGGLAGARWGSQLALTGVVLADGTWLLAWSRFDGEDDEVVWAARRDGRWSAPARVSADNRVPDVLPALGRLGSGAVLAWSRYDGNDYRLVLARLDGRSVRDERMVGEAGSLDATFIAGAEGPLLLYKATRPSGWSVLELDRAGRIKARGIVETPERSRPLLVEAAGAPRLRWPAQGDETTVRLRPAP